MASLSKAISHHRMPAEWDEHESTWLAWPHDAEAWTYDIHEVEQIYIEMIRQLTRGENVNLLVSDQKEYDRVSRLFKENGIFQGVFCHVIHTEGPWIRDYGPIVTVAPNEPAQTRCFKFNAWGGKYDNLAKDQASQKQIARLFPQPVTEVDMVLEGGSIDVNGAGAGMVTEQCLLAPNRNPGFGREKIEQYLAKYLGMERVIWLGQGIVGDDTDGHIDDIARFVDTNKVVCALEEDPADENYKPLKDNWERLQKAVTADGKPIEVIALPMPGKVMSGKERLPASYANFYIANRVVLVPIYEHANDDRAIAILSELFPTRNVIGIPCAPLVRGFGAIHCVTREEPKHS